MCVWINWAYLVTSSGLLALRCLSYCSHIRPSFVFSFICNLPVWWLRWSVLPSPHCMFCQLCLHGSPLDLDVGMNPFHCTGPLMTCQDLTSCFFKMVLTLRIRVNPFGIIIRLQKLWKNDLQLHVNHKLLCIKQRNGCMIMTVWQEKWDIFIERNMDFLTMLASSPI